MTDMNSGYSGFSMSKRAEAAYEDEQMPKSKWTKTAMLSRIEDYAAGEDITIPAHVYKLTKDQLFDLFFEYAGWHHTSRFCNETDFYQLNEKYFESHLEDKPWFDGRANKKVKAFMQEHDFHFLPTGSTEKLLAAINAAEDNPSEYNQYGYPREQSFNLNDPKQCALAIELDSIYNSEEAKFNAKWEKIFAEDIACAPQEESKPFSLQDIAHDCRAAAVALHTEPTIDTEQQR